MVLKVMYVIELLDADDGGIELVDPAWTSEKGSETVTGTDYDLNISDAQSEFSEYSSISRKSTSVLGPEEGPPRKKIKSPPAISPTGSSTSLYSGGSSIDWTTTGTTLDMQGTRVTRTQYGFRTLQESSAKMCLKVTGYPLPEITWYKDDVLLKEDERRTFYADDDGFFAMTIDPVQATDTGRYTCVATNEYGQASTSAFFKVLKVEKEAAPPAFTNSLRDQECKEGEVVNFECEVEGWPEPELVWLVDEQPLRPSHDFRLQYDGQKASLEIRDAQPDDTGIYAVRITNEFGTKETNAKLVVQPDPDKNHVAPEFQAVTEDVECDEGDTVKFKAVITGDPEPDIVWYVNGHPLTPSEKIKFISEDGICIVTIKDVSRHFDGTITCEGKNRLGTTTCDARLKVRVPPLPPQFDRPLEDRIVTEKSAVMFEVDVSGYPDPRVEFFLKGKKLEDGVNGVTIQQRDNYYKVTIQNCSMNEHDGEILARAINDHGQAESRARLVVEPEEEDSRSAPTFLKDIEDQTVKMGEKATFTTSVKGSPNPTVSWYINGTKLESDNQFVTIEANGSDHKLVVDSTKYAGTVLCRAENSIGRFETKARLIVLPLEKKKKAPEFTQPLRDVTELEGNTAVFEVTVDAEPKATLTWKLNGNTVIENDKFKFREFNGSSKLEIHNIDLKDVGQVTCTATNSEGEATSQAKLSVTRHEQKPILKKKPNNATVPIGQRVTFEAQADAVPSADFTWYIDGKKVWNSTPGTSIQTDVQTGTTKLNIDTNLLPNPATIVIVAENKLGTDEGMAQLFTTQAAQEEYRKEEHEKLKEHAEFNVHSESAEPSTTISHEKLQEGGRQVISIEAEEPYHRESVERFEEHAHSNVQGLQEVSGFNTLDNASQQLVMQRELFNQRVQRGHQAQFQTVVKNANNVKWWMGDQLLGQTTPGVRFSEGPANEHILIVESAQSSTTIKFEAGSGDNQIQSLARLDVADRPTFSHGGLNPVVKVEEGQPVVLNVKFTEEAKVNWSYNDRPITEAVPGAQVTTQDGESILRIPEAKSEMNNAILGVSAENEFGKASEETRLVVDKKGEPPKITKGPPNKSVHEHEVVLFSAEVSQVQPTPTVEWRVNGELVTPTHPIFALSQVGNQFMLRVNDAAISHSGNVTVTAKNTAGEDSAQSTFEVKKKPKPVPSFKQGIPGELNAKEGEPLKVTVSAPNADQINWSLNGVPLKDGLDGVQITQNGPESTLHIPSVKKDQAGKLGVEAVNESGKQNSDGNLKVTPKGSPPKVTEWPKGAQVTEKDTVQFSSVIEGEPKPEVQWVVNNKPVGGSDDKFVISEDGNRYTIKIKETALDNAGEIQVQAKNPLGSDKAAAYLEVKPAPKPPIFKQKLNDANVDEGKPATFTVTLENPTPDTKVTWTLNGKPLQNGPDSQLTDNGNGTYTLTIPNATPDIAGRISVKAENPIGSNESDANLNVKPALRPPIFKQGLSDQNVDEGKPALFTAILENPTPDTRITWALNGNPVQNGSNAQITDNGNGAYALNIPNATPQHTGEISIKAENPAGSNNSNASLNVKPVLKAPIFKQGLNDANVDEGKPVTFTVALENPSPDTKITWFLNGTPVQAGPNAQITDNGNGTYTLTIPSATPNLTGKVSVKAENPAGVNESNANLNVKPALKAPQFKAKLTDKSVNEGQPIRYDVEIENPTPDTKLTWNLNGQPLANGDKCQIVDHGDGSYHLTLSHATPDMTGQLTVKAENPAGSSDSSAKLEVKAAGDKPKFSKVPQDAETEEEESVKFSAYVSGKPSPKVTWYLNGEEVIHSDAIRVKHDPESGKTSIRIFKPVIPQSGIVKVVAENEHGRIEAQANLKVVKKLQIPEFMTDMTDRQINEGESAKFTTKIVGYPEPEISWTIDGKPITANNIKISASGDVHTLEITDAEISQTGEVSCSATNTKGTKKQNAQLIVKEVGRAPLFIRNLEDKMVDERETVVMLAELDPKVKPKPTVAWFKDGQPLESDDHIKVEIKDNQCKLMILQAQLNDKCRITIKAENAFGTAETAASIAVQRKQMQTKPQFLSELQPLVIQEGDSLQTSILISGNPTPIAKWYINDQLVCQTEDTEIKAENGVYSLVIHGCTTDMTGKIKCTAVNRMGEVSTEGKLNVIAPIPVEFETALCDATCREGDTLKLKAVLVGEPMPDVTWYVNGRKLVESQNIKIHAEKGTYTVTIKDITMDYSGKVLCEAVNEFGKASSEATLKVLPRGEPPDFLEWLSNVRARAGSKVEHKVVFTGDPKPNLYWYINNKEVKDGVDGMTIKTTDNTSVLTINSFRPEDHVGEIICKAENDAGEVSCTANMILYTSDMVSESESDAFAEDRLEDFKEDTREELTRTPTPIMAPSFITKIKDTTAKKGHQAIFECVVPDTKGVCCKWLKDGKEIELIARIRVQTRTIDGHVANELVIDDVQPEDAGKYTVVVENTAGKDQCEATLTVIDALEKKAPDSKAPEFTLKLQDKSTPLKEKVVLECRATGVPEPKISWFKDNQPVAQSGEPIKVESKPDGTQILTLEQAEISSQGEYKCVAENEAGQANTQATIKVQAQPPQFTKPLSDKEVKIGEAIILECSVTGTPQPVVEFYSVVDNVRLQSGTRVAVQHDASNTHWRLVIKDAKENDLRQYKAVAKNAAGEVTCECVVRSAVPKVDKPKIIDGLKQTKVKEGDTTEMGVKVAVNPDVQPEVEWFKDGKKIEPEADHVKILTNHATGEYVLKVVNSKAEDEGQYSVKISNNAGSDQSQAKMAVEREEFVAPEFVQPLENLDVAEHQTADLKVQVTGTPEPQVTWLKDNTPINIDNQHVIRRDGEKGEHSLTVKDARLEDAGKYSCQAVNKAGQAESSANFGVQEETEAPKFIEGLKPVEIKEAETAKFDVVVCGKPEPQVQWFKDGHPVQLDGTHLISSQSADGKHSLTIKDARNEDAGVYTAKAVNKAGSDESKANLGVIEDVEAPEFIKPLEDLDIKPADVVKLEVKVAGKPEPQIAWTKDGIPINIDEKHIISKKEADGSHSLTINEATTSDAGTYSCQASNKAGRKESIGNINFGKEGESNDLGENVAPMFIEPLKQLNIEEGKPTELICKVNPESKPEIKWFKDGQLIQPSPNLIMEQSEDGIIKLTIKNASSTDVGEYRCEAVNKAGQDKTIGALKYASILTIEGGEEEGGFLGFAKELQDQTVEKAKDSVFECQLDQITAQNPDVSVEWAKNGAPIKKGTPVREADGVLKLKLDNTEVEDSGSYQCTVKTKDSEAFTSANLTVTDGSGDGQGKGAPEFVELLKSCTVPEEQQAVLTCKVKGSPRPTIKWYKNGAELKESDDLKLEYAEDGRITLTIKKTKMDDSAEYRCVAENDHGTAWTEGPVVVTSKGAAKVDGEAPDFVQPVRPVNVEVGKDATFVGKVTGKPFPEIKWYQGKNEISPANAKFKIESDSDGTQRLIVKDCKLEDAGEFRCAASNQYGDVWADTTLTVITPSAKAPEFEKELEAVDAKQGEDAIFECKLADDDNSKVDWYKGNEKLVPSGNVIIEALPNGVHRLILKNVSPDDQGNYRVEAVNPSGSASSKAPLNVQPASEFRLKKGLQDQNLKRGQKLHLSVEVEGKPSSVKWYKDDQEISGNNKYIFEKITEDVFSLTVESSELNDSGSYKVFLSNGVQSVESSCKVIVTEQVQGPSFKKPLSDATVPKGSPIRLEVEVEGNPTSVKWFKDGEPLPDNLAQDLGGGRYAINIPEAKAEDFGRYSVQVANENGQASSACNVNEDKGKGDEGGNKPKIVEGLIPQTVNVGEAARFQIKVEGPVKQVKWYKNGKELGPEKTKEVAPGVYSLEIPQAEKEDSGEFKVVVSNDFGEADSNAALTVKLPPIKIVKGLEDLEVPKGTEAVLIVETDRPPKAIKWYKNGKEISPNDKSKASDVKPNVFQLVIPDAEDEDAGTFKAIVFNDDDEPSETSCALTVKLPPKVNEKPKILDGLGDKFVPVGKELEATIKTSGNPTQIKWYKNGAELSPHANLLLQKVDDNTFTLRIPKASLDDTGNYEVVVSNNLGSDESKGKVTVEEPITFLKPLKDQEVIENERVEFTVETNTKPHTIKWYRNGQEITPDNRVELTQDGNVISCVLKWAQSSDQGQFKVVLTNSAGPAESEAKLTVNKKVTKPPKIVKGLDNAIVAKGDAIIFEVVVDGEVTDVKWLKDGKNVTNEPGFKIEKVDDKTYRLTIPVSELDHAGEYEVQLSNDGGKATSSAVAEVDELPKIVKGLIPGDVDEGDEHLFRVEVSSPVREVKWYKNGQELVNSPEGQLKEVSPKKYELLIPSSVFADSGDYKVVLSNKAGSCDSAAPLVVKKLQTVKLIKPLHDVTLDEGQELLLSCQIEGTPKAVKWYKNGQEITPTDRLLLSSNDNGEYVLKVPSAVSGDGAAYRVVFETDKGDVQTGCVAHVRPKKEEEQKSQPTFVSPLQDVTIPEGEILTLKCQVNGQPTPTVKWYRNGQELVPSDRIVQRLALDGTATLRIMDAKKDDAGDFKVVAVNEVGSAESSCTVKVLSGDELPSAPKFIIPLKDTKTPIGGTAVFNVKVKGTPKPEITFTLNGSPLPVDGQKVILEDLADGNWSLTIKDVTDADFGNLKCTAQNENGKAESSAVFGVDDSQKGAKEDEGYPPKFNVPLWDRRVVDRQPTSIECHVDAKPRADIVWLKDGKELASGNGVEIDNTFDGACRVKFTEFKEENCGQYKCVAKNIYGVADTIAHLSIETEGVEEVGEEKESAPRFNPGLTDQKINQGEDLVLSCKVEGVPKPSLVWYKDGIPLTATDVISIDYDEDTGDCRLKIQGATDQHQGAYRCVASNKNGTTNTACLVTVHSTKEEKKKEGAEPFFTKGLVDQWLDRGETLTLHCEVTGDPAPEIKWYRNGQLLKPTDKISIENSPDGKCTCTIKDCNMTDEGVYRCEAENVHGKAKTQCNAHVDMELSKAEPLKVDEGQPPRFIIPLEDVTTLKSSNVALECKVTGVPMPSCKWTKDGVPLFDDNHFEWDNNPAAGTYRLLIKDFTQHYEGTYRCVATNESGSATTKAFVKLDDSVGDRKDVRPPQINAKLSDVRVNEGQPLTLECRIDSDVTPEVTWYKDGAKVIPSDRIQLELTPEGYARLIIPSSTLGDDGMYRIVATNEAGTAHDKCTATVKKASRPAEATPGLDDGYGSGKAPKVVIPLETIRVNEKQGFTLRCKFSGAPKLAIKWFKDGERLYSYSHAQITENDDGSTELVVTESAKSDAGTYRCVAENDYGSARTTGQVAVTVKSRQPRSISEQLNKGKAPGFTIPLTIKKAKLGDTVTFECLPYGEPFPGIKWMKDGMELLPKDGIKIEAAEDGTQRLIVENIDMLSEGYYRCVATNEHGTASTKAELVLIGDKRPKAEPEVPAEPEEGKPRIRPGLHNQSVHQGNTIEMQICAIGLPTPTVKWYKDGEELHSDGSEGKRTIWTDERGFHHLVIINAMPEDEGEYTVTATNPHGEAKSTGNVSVILPRAVADEEGHHGLPFPPGFIRQLKNKHVFTKLPTIFDCLVVGYPPPEVEWFHNGKRITPGGRIKIQSCGGSSHALLITDTNVDDAGEYVAIAKNSHGTASSSAILDVTVPHLDEIKFDGTIDITPYLTEEYGFKKINYKCLPTPPDYGPFIKEVTGHYLTLSWIPTKRSPPRYPQVTYVVEIRELPYRDWTLLDYNIPEPVCKVRNLELGKSYQFRVRAENIYGISDPSPASPPSRLMAPPPPVMDRNKRIIPLLDPYAERALDLAYAEQYACSPWFAPGAIDKRYCAENDTLIVNLKYSGYPDPKITWKFRGWDVDTSSPTSNIRVTNYGGSDTSLTFTSFSKDNVGQYQCIATNQYGEAQQNVYIDLATRPTFLQPLTNRTFQAGKPFKLDVRVEGTPFPEIKWMKEWHPVVESSRIKMIHEGPYLCSLIINDPMWRDSGIYSCVAFNDAGQASTSGSITVEEVTDYAAPRRKRKVDLEQKNVREIYEIAEEDEHKAAMGAFFRVKHKETRKMYIAQLKPLNHELSNYISINNVIDGPNLIHLHAAIAEKGLAVLIFDADRSLLDSLVAHRPGDHVEVFGAEREAQVRIFAKQLLTALQYMHHRSIAHLDLRPEAVLLQDDHLRLADFGQSRHLLRGKVTGNIKATPEFVSPEIAQGQTVTLAADMWSAGSLIYVLLTGVSPFLGDNDRETLTNIINGNYSLDSEAFTEISVEAKDFLQKLLLLDPGKRMTIDQALSHDWLADPALRDAKLRTDCLREFKYQHKWLERRVFVQQTPSDQLTQMLESPRRALAQIEKVNAAGSLPQRAEPYVIYDYNAIKAHDDGVPEFVPGTNPQPRPIPKHIQEQIRLQLQRPPPPFYDPKSMPQPGQDPRQAPPTGSGIPPNLRPEEILTQLGIDPRKLQGFQGALPPPEGPRSPNSQRKRLEPQAKGETPSQRSSPKPQLPSAAEDEENQPVPPIQLIRGENRQIQYELATRNLSDISEECSVAGSVASLDDVQDIPPKDKNEAHSRSTTPRAESDSSTPLASPTLTIESNEPNPIQLFFGDHEIPSIRDLNDPKIPVGAPIFLEELNKGQPLTVQLPIRTGGKKSPASLSPASNRSTGTKSPIQYSPGQEHQMECVIAVKYGKQRRVFGMGEETRELDAKEDDGDGKAKSATANIQTHDNGNLERLAKDPLADLEKYRVKNYYKDDDMEFERREMDVDDYPWESNYQIGPETLLLATKGANFNARVRDYRRMLWGDGAPLVSQGILGYRNQDITVRERRRFTDLLREDTQIAKSVEKVDRELGQTIMGSVRRHRPELIVQDGETTVRPDGCFRPIFKKRLHDVCLIEDGNNIMLDCQVIGNPRPEVTWYHQGSALKDDQKFKIIYEGDISRLIINKPMFVDAGEFSCTATNELGNDSTSCRLVSGSEPGRPGRPEVNLASDTEVFIAWEPPEHRPSMFGIYYRLESRPAGDNDHFAVWTVISDKVEAEFVVVKHLSPGGIYQFRVTACNGFGWGEPSLTSRIIRTHSRGVPKLNMDILRREHRLQIVAMPQKMTKAKSGLTEICEEEEEDEEDQDEKASSVSSVKDENLSILNEEPTNRFDLLHEIFRGKFSLVREAADKNSGKRCCVKVRPFDQTEFDTLLASQHENVVKLVAGYKKSNCLLLFTECLAENVFDRFVATDPYTEEHVALTVRQICSALHWIHFKGVLHLDVQPNNVMFAERRSWLVKLIDFDRAGIIGNTKEINPKTLNPEWAPPEILKGEKPTTETDVWGLGIVSFCLLAGFHPFSSEGDNVDTIRNAVLTEKCDPNLIPVQASQEALRFATWALKKDPRRRMRTEEALAHRFLANDATMVRRRENIKYSNSRIQRTSYRTLFRKPTQLWDGNVEKFGEGPQQPPPRQGFPSNGAQFGGLGPMPALQRNGSAGKISQRSRPREV